MVVDNVLARSRLIFIKEALEVATDEVLIRRLRNGEYEGELRHLEVPNTPLTFEELCRWNTWFFIYPHKQAGLTKYSTSRDFPVKIEGDKNTIIATLDKGIAEAKRKTAKPNNISILRLKAKAIKIKIKIELELKRLKS